MDSYLLTSTRTPCPRLLRPIPAPSPPPPALSGWEPRPHLVALGIPPTTAAASRGHPALLRGYSDPKRNGAFIPWREVCEPFPVRGGNGGDGALPVQLGGLEMHSSRCRDQEPRAILWIAWGHCCPHRPGGTLCHAPPLPLHPPGAGRKGLELGRGVNLSSIPTFPTAAFPPKPRLLWPLPQSLPCFRGSGRSRAGCEPLVSPRDPEQDRESPRGSG